MTSAAAGASARGSARASTAACGSITVRERGSIGRCRNIHMRGRVSLYRCASITACERGSFSRCGSIHSRGARRAPGLPGARVTGGRGTGPGVPAGYLARGPVVP